MRKSDTRSRPCCRGMRAGAAAAAAAVGNRAAARSYYTKLVELADGGTRPELGQAKAYLQQVNR